MSESSQGVREWLVVPIPGVVVPVPCFAMLFAAVDGMTTSASHYYISFRSPRSITDKRVRLFINNSLPNFRRTDASDLQAYRLPIERSTASGFSHLAGYMNIYYTYLSTLRLYL